MKTWIYSWIVYPIGLCVAHVVGLFNTKVRETLRVRAWKDFLSLRLHASQPIEYWVHVASYGELEYAIPVLEELGRRNKRVLVTYYSISAKEAVEKLPSKYSNVSLVVPLPHDGLGLMKEFVELVNKQGVRFLLPLKYELWPGLLWECNARAIRVMLVDALKPGWFHRRLLHKLDAILAGYDSEIEGVSHRFVKTVGDTRVERVIQRLKNSTMVLSEAVGANLTARFEKERTFVCGSTWPDDDELILKALRIRMATGDAGALIWVPHELDEKQCARMTAELKKIGFKTVRLGDGAQDLSSGPVALIVMKKGFLADLYRLGTMAWVGGGFGKGVHSVWEPALAGCVVGVGPAISRSPEASLLRSKQMLSVFENGETLAAWLSENRWGKPREAANGKMRDLEQSLNKHIGASVRIVDSCEELKARGSN